MIKGATFIVIMVWWTLFFCVFMEAIPAHGCNIRTAKAAIRTASKIMMWIILALCLFLAVPTTAFFLLNL